MAKRTKMPADKHGAYTNTNFERSAPSHPDTEQSHGAYTYSEKPLLRRDDGNRIGSNPVGSHRPAVQQIHGYGHTASQRQGALRTSGHPHASQIGKRR